MRSLINRTLEWPATRLLAAATSDGSHDESDSTQAKQGERRWFGNTHVVAVRERIDRTGRRCHVRVESRSGHQMGRRVQPVIRACILELLVRKNGPRAMLWVSKVHGKHWQGGRYEHRREEGV